MCLGLHGHPGGAGQPLIAPKPVGGHRPGQRHPHDHVLVGGVQLDV
jgi:hypothetical protein